MSKTYRKNRYERAEVREDVVAPRAGEKRRTRRVERRQSQRDLFRFVLTR